MGALKVGTRTMATKDERNSGKEAGALQPVVNTWQRFRGFLSDVRTEMKHVSYPSRKEVQATTLVVVITVGMFGVFFYVVDFVMSRSINWIFGRFTH
jgi:preprotein translocase subunit SecE